MRGAGCMVMVHDSYQSVESVCGIGDEVIVYSTALIPLRRRGVSTLCVRTGWLHLQTIMTELPVQPSLSNRQPPRHFSDEKCHPSPAREWVRWFCRTVDSWKSTVLNPDLKREPKHRAYSPPPEGCQYALRADGVVTAADYYDRIANATIPLQSSTTLSLF